jgi:hypothetical protein
MKRIYNVETLRELGDLCTIDHEMVSPVTPQGFSHVW